MYQGAHTGSGQIVFYHPSTHPSSPSSVHASIPPPAHPFAYDLSVYVSICLSTLPSLPLLTCPFICFCFHSSLPSSFPGTLQSPRRKQQRGRSVWWRVEHRLWGLKHKSGEIQGDQDRVQWERHTHTVLDRHNVIKKEELKPPRER